MQPIPENDGVTMAKKMEVWNVLKTPPPSALKKIGGGRLKGMTDINPQWRYQIMTEQFGMCGVGWKYEIFSVWTSEGSDGQKFAFAEIRLFVRQNGEWSDAIPGVGGSMLVEKETRGLHSSDEGYKMAITDALSVAMKMIGVAADIYMGLSDSKYKDKPTVQHKKRDYITGNEKESTDNEMSIKQWNFIKSIGAKAHELTEKEIVDMVKWKAEQENLSPRHWKMSKLLLPEENFADVFM